MPLARYIAAGVLLAAAYPEPPCCAQAVTDKEKALAQAIDSRIVAVPTPFNGNVLAAINGHVVLSKCYGYTNFDSHEKLNPDTMFDIASVSKQFTAMCIMILKELGKLAYEDDLKKYFPDLPYEGVTIRHLLNHTSGIPDYNEYMQDPIRSFGSRRVLKNNDILQIMTTRHPAPHFKPGAKFEYSNTGYVILASIVARVSGMEFGDFMTTNIFKPLGMARTRMFTTQREKHEKLPNRADGYVFSNRLQKFVIADEDERWGDYVYMMDGIQGDGGLNTTTQDLYKWWQGLRSNKLVKPATQLEAYTPCKLNSGEETVSGFGWFIEKKPDVGRIISHSGGHPGYGSYIVQFPDLNGVFIVLSNNSGRGTKGLIEDVIRQYGLAKG